MKKDTFRSIIIKIGYFVLSIVFIAGCFLFTLDNYNAEEKALLDEENMCRNLCESNSFNFLKLEYRGYGGRQEVCYCEAQNGAIRTFIM